MEILMYPFVRASFTLGSYSCVVSPLLRPSHPRMFGHTAGRIRREWSRMAGPRVSHNLDPSEGRRNSLQFVPVCEGGASHPEIAELAALGSFGLWRSNIHAQLTRKYLSTCTAPLADSIRISAIDPLTLKPMFTECWIMAPHEWFSWLGNSFPDEFDQLFVAKPLQEFWSHISRSV
jgi:hypothetical protein